MAFTVKQAGLLNKNVHCTKADVNREEEMKRKRKRKKKGTLHLSCATWLMEENDGQ